MITETTYDNKLRLAKESFCIAIAGEFRQQVKNEVAVPIKFSDETQQRIDSCAMNKVAQEKAKE